MNVGRQEPAAQARTLQPPGIENAEALYARIQEENRRFWPRFSDTEYQRRYHVIRKAMAESQIDCLLMFSNGYLFSPNLIYVGNYIDLAYGCLVFPLEHEPTLFVSLYSFLPQAAAQSVIRDIRWGAGVYSPPIVDRVKEVGLEKGTLGIADRLPHDVWLFLQEALPQAKFVDARRLMQQIRLCASAEELQWYQRGAEICDQTFATVVEAVEPGMKDYEVVGIIHGTYLKLGGSLFGAGFASTPMANPSIPYPWWVAGGSTRTIQRGDLILTEITGTYYGYPGQLIRPVALDEPPPELRKLEELAVSLYREAQKVVKVGNTPRDVLALSQRILDAGYTIQCPVIHGYTQTINAPYASVPGDPCWAADLDVPFQENQLIVIEPNPTARDMQRGIFIGDMNRVTREGAVSLHRYPLRLTVKTA